MFKLKEIIKLTIYQVIYYCVKSIPVKTTPARLLLVKPDEIGDYMLIRNLLHYFRNAPIYRNYKITFVGNGVFKQIFDKYDSEIADDTIWINKKKFRQNFFYRFNILRQIRSAAPAVAINLIHTRSFRLDDMMIAVTDAPEKIGMKSDGYILVNYERSLIPTHLYTRLMDQEERFLFDANRNARFIENILKIKIESASTALDVNENTDQFSLPPSYFIIFPGSGSKIKKWPAENFARVARHIQTVYGLTPVVCGSPGDIDDAQQFILSFNGAVIDLTGKTTLPQFLAVLKKAACIVSVDTGSVHLAAAVQCPVFGLFSGLHYGRFGPYPKEIAENFFTVYPDEVDQMIEKKSTTDFENVPMGLLSKIPVEKMISVIDKNLPVLCTNKQISQPVSKTESI
ncbi:MAG: glycosyltransferase family 9 protein [Bacteroidetes bacterium]|nr:glycosyltransferase family 9 protein [Bacteroidota bacterium]